MPPFMTCEQEFITDLLNSMHAFISHHHALVRNRSQMMSKGGMNKRVACKIHQNASRRFPAYFDIYFQVIYHCDLVPR